MRGNKQIRQATTGYCLCAGELSMSPDSEVVYLIKNENNAMLLTLNVLHHQQKQQIQYQQQQHQQGSNALRPCDCHW